MRRSSVTATVALCFSLLLPVATAGASDRWAVCGEWREVPVPAEPDSGFEIGGAGYVTDVEMISPYEAWAISDEGYESWNETHVYHWGGVRWEEVPFPTPPMAEDGWEYWSLSAIEAVSPNEVWVVGSKIAAPPNNDFLIRPIVGRWDGRHWHLVPTGLWDVHGWLSGITVVPGTRRLIAVGGWSPSRAPHPSGEDESGLAIRWNGTTWHRMPTPDPGRWTRFADVVAAGSNVWAVGTGLREGEGARLYASRLTLAGWTVRWGPRGDIAAASAVSGREIWAVGATRRPQQGLVARWDGQSWRAARRFDRIESFSDVVVPAPGQVWAVGETFVPALNAPRPFIVRRTADGWRIDWTSDEHGHVTAIGGTPNNLWAFLSYPPVEWAEVWRFTSLHRC